MSVPHTMTNDDWNPGRFLAHRITQLGVHDFFVVPGDYNLILLDHMLSNPQLRMLNCCNELNTGYAADGYARSHPQKLAVVVVTYMVGSLSILNAIAGAYSEGLRVVIICGGPPARSYNHPMRVHHSLGLADKGQSQRMFDNVTCASVCLDGDSTAGDIDRVLQRTLDDSRPVYIEIPVDMSVPNAAYDPVNSTAPALALPAPDASRIHESAQRIQTAWQSAKSPVVLVGGGTRGQLAREAIDQLVQALGCAVFYLPDGKSRVSETLPQCGGLFWSLLSDPGVEDTVRASDLWITLGCSWNDLHTLQVLDLSSVRNLSIANDTVRTPDGHEITQTPMHDLVQHLLTMTLPSTALLPNPTSLKTLHQNRAAELQNQKQIAESDSDSAPSAQITVDRIASKLSSILRPSDTVLSDAGQSWFTASQIHLPPGADFQLQLLYASTGWSLPATMGGARARSGTSDSANGKDGRCIAVIGDGSLQMVCQEVSTMARNRINAVVVIINNCGYQVEDAIHKGPYNEIGHWDYVSLVEAMWAGPRAQNQKEDKKVLANGDATVSSTLCRDEHQSHGDHSDPPHRMFTKKVITDSDLDEALKEADRWPRSTLAVLECCVDPNRVSSALEKFGSKLGRG